LNNLLADSLENAEDLEKDDLLEMMKTCEDSSRRLSSFFEDALVWARSEAGGDEERETAFSLNDAFISVRSLLLPLFEKKKVRLESNIPPGAAGVCRSNAFATVLRNLLSNAVKFSDAGSCVSFRAEVGDKTTKILIADEGVGMSTDRIKSLFDPDKRRSTLGTDKEKGAGVGLILCQSLVEKMGGVLAVTSEKAKGSTFSFEVRRYVDGD
jgi:signal transduction histidine kinase